MALIMDVDNIWSNVSSFIERQMSSQKGVCVSGLGTFTFSLQKMDMGNKQIPIQRPIFLLSERLALTHGLKQTKALPAGEVPVVQLNFAALSLESPFEREQVQGCVRETLLLLQGALSSQHCVLFSFHNIGLLSVQHPRAGCGLLMELGSAPPRCQRCQRRSSYRGGTNVWKDTHYTAGSRLML